MDACGTYEAYVLSTGAFGRGSLLVLLLCMYGMGFITVYTVGYTIYYTVGVLVAAPT